MFARKNFGLRSRKQKDFVDFNLETTNDKLTGVINNIHDRKNYIVRRSVNLSKQTHIIASNIDQVFLLITIEDPLTSTTFIDRFFYIFFFDFNYFFV